jgi:hypothetical protein
MLFDSYAQPLALSDFLEDPKSTAGNAAPEIFGLIQQNPGK